MYQNESEAPPDSETRFADSNDGVEVASPDGEPLYARQSQAEHPETDLELHEAPDLPSGVAELTAGLSRSIEDGGLLSYALAARFGALGHCDLCGRPFIHAPALAAALATEHGIADDERLPFEDAIRRSPLEQANESAPNFCSYHGQITSE